MFDHKKSELWSSLTFFVLNIFDDFFLKCSRVKFSVRIDSATLEVLKMQLGRANRLQRRQKKRHFSWNFAAGLPEKRQLENPTHM